MGVGEVGEAGDDGSMGGGKRLNAVWKQEIVVVSLIDLSNGFNCKNADGET